MLCPNCGANNIDGALTCVACGTPLPAGPAHAPAEAAAPASPAYDPAPAPAYSANSPAVSPGHPPPAASALIPNYLVQSILVTLFCCIPSGIVAIVFSSQVNTKLAAGDLQGAAAASNTAKMWCIVGLCIGLVVWLFILLYIVLVVILGIAGAAASHQ